MNNQYERYPSSVSEEELSKSLALVWEKDMQDWDLIAANSSRLDEFMTFYQQKLKDDDDKFTLMGLIVASFDDLAPNFDKDTAALWDVCKTILEKECYLHYSTIVYWCFRERISGKGFPISLLMRDVWDNVKHNFD